MDSRFRHLIHTARSPGVGDSGFPKLPEESKDYLLCSKEIKKRLAVVYARMILSRTREERLFLVNNLKLRRSRMESDLQNGEPLLLEPESSSTLRVSA